MPDADRLFDLVEGQQGFFTTAQATEAGYAPSTHSYHVAAGNWVREHRGIYRLRRYPLAEDGQLVLWSLWSRNRRGQAEGVYSHLTALRIHDLTDANPSRLDMIVPSAFRRSSEIPGILVLHKANLAPEEIIHERGYSITTLLRTTIDLAVSGEADRSLVRQALRAGRSRGLISRGEIARARRGDRLPDWLLRLVEEGD